MSRILTASLLANKTFKVTETAIIKMRRRPNAPDSGDLFSRWMGAILLGRPNTNGKFHRVPVGLRYAQKIVQTSHCYKDGEALFGLCPSCHTMIDGPRISVKSVEEHGFAVSREVGKHDIVPYINPLKRGSLIITKEKETLMVVEEREYSKNGTMILLHVEGASVNVSVACKNEMDQKVSDKATGEHWSGPVLMGVDRLLSMQDHDRITIARTLSNGREEEIQMEIRNQWPRIVKAKVLKDPSKAVAQTAPEVAQTIEKATEPEVSGVEDVSDEVNAEPTPEEIEDKLPSLPEPGMMPAAVEAVQPKPDPVIEEAVKQLIDIDGSALEMESVKKLFRHVNDPRHVKRIGDDASTDKLVDDLVAPLRVMATLKPMPEHSGKPFVFRFSGERKIVGDFTTEGKLWVKTLYGKGNPVDRLRESIDITPNES